MPYYDYKCTNEECGHIEYDVKRPITENVGLYVCPKCGSDMHQTVHLFGFDLKGTGWYKDGYSGGNTSVKKRDEIDDLKK